MFILGQEIFVYLFFFMFILGQEISSCALFALRRSHGCRFGRESWLSQVHWQRGGLQVNIAVLKKKMPKTDTLDALNDAMTTIFTTNLDWDMPDIWLPTLATNLDYQHIKSLSTLQKCLSLRESPTWIQETLLVHLKRSPRSKWAQFLMFLLSVVRGPKPTTRTEHKGWKLCPESLIIDTKTSY